MRHGRRLTLAAFALLLAAAVHAPIALADLVWTRPPGAEATSPRPKAEATSAPREAERFPKAERTAPKRAEAVPDAEGGGIGGRTSAVLVAGAAVTLLAGGSLLVLGRIAGKPRPIETGPEEDGDDA